MKNLTEVSNENSTIADESPGEFFGLTADQIRRLMRAELHAARCRDQDQSGPRYASDALELDRRMTEAGHPPHRPTDWCRGNAPTACVEAPRIDFQGLGDMEVAP